MLLDNSENILKIIKKTQFSIFSFPKNSDFPEINRAVTIQPNEKNTITIEDIRQIPELTRNKQYEDLIFVVKYADRLTDSAANSFLKLLEEPSEKIHFAFFIESGKKLLPTILSRAHNFELKTTQDFSVLPEYSPETLSLAKTYISASPLELVKLSTTLAKDRNKSLAVIDASIDILFRSYLKTSNPKFLDKLDSLLKSHSAIEQNGHVRLQLVANMLQ